MTQVSRTREQLGPSTSIRPGVAAVAALVRTMMKTHGWNADDATERVFLVLTQGRSSPTVHLAELGQRVTFLRDAERTPELTDEERRQTFVIKTTVGDGENQFVRLATLDGREFGWFRVTQLAPADAAQKEQRSPVPERTTSEDTTMQDTKTTKADIEQKAAAFAARVTGLSKDRPLRDAIILATAQDAEGAEAYRLHGVGAEAGEEAAAPVLNLSARSGESFDQLAQRYALEKGVSLRQAIHDVGKARPDLAAAR